MTKALIFDSGTLINLSINGLLQVVEELKKNFDGKFLITPQVKYEILDKPIKIQRFELEALRIKDLIERKIIELPESLNISQEELSQKTREIMNIVNTSVFLKNQSIKIVSEGEMSCLALSNLLTQKSINNIIAIDERTTRAFVESPKDLERLISSKIHKQVRIKPLDMNKFKQFRFIRSSELVYVAYKKGLIKIKDSRLLEALLYATKFKGAAISWDEINVLKKLA